MMISGETPLPLTRRWRRAKPATPSRACWASRCSTPPVRKARVLTLDAPDDNATFRTTILDMQTLMNQA